MNRRNAIFNASRCSNVHIANQSIRLGCVFLNFFSSFSGILCSCCLCAVVHYVEVDANKSRRTRAPENKKIDKSC